MNEKRQSTESKIKMGHMMELSNVDLKSSYYKKIQKAITNACETNKKREILSRELENIKGTKWKLNN